MAGTDAAGAPRRREPASVVGLLQSEEIGAAPCRRGRRLLQPAYLSQQLGCLTPRGAPLHDIAADLDKAFCSAWLDDDNLLVGTKCNSLVSIHAPTQRAAVLAYPEQPLLRAHGPDLMAGAGARHHCGQHAMALSPSGRFLATGGSAAEDVLLWQLGGGSGGGGAPAAAAGPAPLRPLATCMGHSDWVFGLAWLGSDRHVVSVGRDRLVKVWELPQGTAGAGGSATYSPEPHAAALSVQYHQDKVRAVTYEPQREQVATLCVDGCVGFWSPELLLQGCNRLPEGLREPSCLASGGSLVAVGCSKHAVLLDARMAPRAAELPVWSGASAKRRRLREHPAGQLPGPMPAAVDEMQQPLQLRHPLQPELHLQLEMLQRLYQHAREGAAGAAFPASAAGGSDSGSGDEHDDEGQRSGGGSGDEGSEGQSYSSSSDEYEHGGSSDDEDGGGGGGGEGEGLEAGRLVGRTRRRSFSGGPGGSSGGGGGGREGDREAADLRQATQLPAGQLPANVEYLLSRLGEDGRGARGGGPMMLQRRQHPQHRGQQPDQQRQQQQLRGATRLTDEGPLAAAGISRLRVEASVVSEVSVGGTGVRSLSLHHHLLGIGGSSGSLLFHDLRMPERPLRPAHAEEGWDGGEGGDAWRQRSRGRLPARVARLSLPQPARLELDPGFAAMSLWHGPVDREDVAIYSHAWDPTSTKVFGAGGPLAVGLRGCSLMLWSAAC